MPNFIATYEYLNRSMRGARIVRYRESEDGTTEKAIADRLESTAASAGLEKFKIIKLESFNCTYCRDTGIGEDQSACCII